MGLVRIPILITNRVRIDLTPSGEDTETLAQNIREQFEHSNPNFLKMKRLKLPTWKEPAIIRTWKKEGHWLTVPRGGLARVRQAFTLTGHTFDVIDERTEGEKNPEVSWPDETNDLSLYGYQQEAVSQCIAKQNCLLRAPTGCLAGDTIIHVQREGKKFEMKISDLVSEFNGGNYYWNPEIPIFLRSRATAGYIKLHELADAYESGEKVVYEVEILCGYRIRATMDHKFLTSTGWRPLHMISVGDEVRIVLNGKRDSLSKIVRIEEHSSVPTYDLEMKGEPHNFVANGFVVHNSGKTRMGFAIAQALKLPTLVVVWSGALHDQWTERAHDELGLPPDCIGTIQGKKRDLKPITVAMSQTISKGVDPEVRDHFGVILFDEVQRAAANTMFQSVDPFPAKYRIGISADHSRKDRKEFLTHDLFGAVAADIQRERLVESGHVLDVEIRCIPTRFRADWYGVSDAPEDDKRIDFNRLLDEMCSDKERNELAIACAMRHVPSEQVLVMSHRREHCIALDHSLVEHGCKTGYLIGGEDYKTVFRDSVEGLKSGALSVGVGTLQAIGQGLDLPRVSIAVVATPIAGNRQNFGQVRGRVCRIANGKDRAILYYLLDTNVYGRRHLKNLMAWNPTVRVLHRGKFVEAENYLT